MQGFRFRRLGSEATARVVSFRAVTGTLVLDSEVAGVERGTSFELLSPEEAPILAARMVTLRGAAEPLPPIRMRLATTRGTNALLERRGAPLALFVTRGFADLVEIGTQQRPDLFALGIQRRQPLHARVVEVQERLGSDGAVVQSLDVAAVAEAARAARQSGICTAAIVLMHAYLNDEHERTVEALLHEAGFEHVSRSSAIAPSINLLDRAITTVTDAYLAPTLVGYLKGVESALPRGPSGDPSPLHVMTSAGGLVRPGEFSPKDSLLSGPAGGVVGAAAAARLTGHERLITFDMGGTSTDVARYDGEYDYVWRHQVGDVDLLAPALAISSVAAGGGSICGFRAGGLAVGPESAGAVPGPACYGAGGPLTITDCNLLLGRIDPARFGIPVSVEAARRALERLSGEVARETGEPPDPMALAAGLVEIADERMADAIRSISIRRGFDPAEYALVVFGGAGGQHGCGVARRLGIRRIIVPPDPGLLSAFGLGRARLERVAQRQVLRPLSGNETWLQEEVDRLAGEASAAVAREGLPANRVTISRRIANLRFAGQESTLPIELAPELAIRDAFITSYAEVFGHVPDSLSIEIESLRVIASAPPADSMPEADPPPSAPGDPAPQNPQPHPTSRLPLVERREISDEASFDGPCLVQDRHSIIFVERGWSASVAPSGALLISDRAASTPDDDSFADGADSPIAVREQLFTSRFQAIVAEMGAQLQRTALSTNVKERLDFSCALLNPQGELVANAPHIPVHLGALGLCVRSVAAVMPLAPGDVVITNHPAFGGSHLPDVTVITPVYTGSEALLGYVASRAHHAEIGGSVPGSMPPDARTLVEEGVVIPPTLLVEGGRARWGRVEALLNGGPHPSRAVRENLADLRAQLAANHRGGTLLRELGDLHGREMLMAQMGALAARADRGLRRALTELSPGSRTAEEHLDDGSRIAVRIEITTDGIDFDFAGTSPVHPGNLNATPAVVRSSILYVLRLLTTEDLPLNEGLLRCAEIQLPRGSLLCPDFPEDAALAPAVVGGNTEVSQRLVDVLLKALRIAACSQGTMNNVIWGTEDFGYYETIGGGEGAGPGYSGASGVHTHMTNTRITDAEILEKRYPVRVESFGIRRGTGGRGRFSGGDGLLRQVTFLAPMSLSVLTQHRRVAPFGMDGGGAGAVGRQRVLRADGAQVELSSVDGCDVGWGDRLVIETPGGGGWGRSDA